MMPLFILLQFVLLVFMVFHDWIPVPPFNNIKALKQVDRNFRRLLGSVINGVTVIIPLLITLAYYQQKLPLSAIIIISLFYLFLTIGTILSWWTPYFFGSSVKHKEQFTKFKDTHHFLPERGDNVVPNTLHFVLHIQVWACFAISIYFLITAFFMNK